MAPKSGNLPLIGFLSMSADLFRLDDQDVLTHVLVELVSRQVRATLVHGDRASIVVPGGRTPVPFFEKLSTVLTRWDRVSVTLTDERWVDVHDPASNERLVRQHLLRNEAKMANFVGLRGDADAAEAGATQAWKRLGVIQRPFDVVVLGMGEDGHFASLFPGDPASQRGLDLHAPPGCVVVNAPAAPSLRVSLNLPALLQAREVVLLITGERKLELLQQELDATRTLHLPVRALLTQKSARLSVLWAP